MNAVNNKTCTDRCRGARPVPIQTPLCMTAEIVRMVTFLEIFIGPVCECGKDWTGSRRTMARATAFQFLQATSDTLQPVDALFDIFNLFLNQLFDLTCTAAGIIAQ